MASAEALAQAAFATAPARNAGDKAAALDAIAQAGSAGKASFDLGKANVDSSRAQAIQYAASALPSGQNLLAGQKDLGFLDAPAGAPQNPNSALGVLSASNSAENQALSNDTQRSSQGLNDYYGRVNAAIPIEQSRTRGVVEQILADERDKQAQRQFQSQMQSISLQRARASLQAKTEKGAKVTPLTASELSQRQSQFIADSASQYGRKTNTALDQILNGTKNPADAMRSLQALARDSNGFTKPIHVTKDSKGRLLAEPYDIDVTHVDPEFLQEAIGQYYSGEPLTSRAQWYSRKSQSHTIAKGNITPADYNTSLGRH